MLSLLLPNDDLREQVYDTGEGQTQETLILKNLQVPADPTSVPYTRPWHYGNKLSFQVEGSQRVQEATGKLWFCLGHCN